MTADRRLLVDWASQATAKAAAGVIAQFNFNWM